MLGDCKNCSERYFFPLLDKRLTLRRIIELGVLSPNNQHAGNITKFARYQQPVYQKDYLQYGSNDPHSRRIPSVFSRPSIPYTYLCLPITAVLYNFYKIHTFLQQVKCINEILQLRIIYNDRKDRNQKSIESLAEKRLTKNNIPHTSNPR